MAKLITLFGLVVAVVAAIGSAAPVAEEASAAPIDINQLLEEANLEENDIIAPKTESTNLVEELSTSLATVDEEPSKQKITEEKEVLVTEDDVSSVVIPTDTSVVVVDSTDKTMDEEKEPLSNITNSVIQKEGNDEFEVRVPVIEIIPEPEVAHVLGDALEHEIYDEDETVEHNINNYQVVQGENEEGTPFISEYQPETIVPILEEDMNEPIIENVKYEYSPDDISPEAVFRIDQILKDSDNLRNSDDIAYNIYNPDTDVNDNMDNIDGFSTYTLEEAIQRDRMTNSDMMHSMDPMPDISMINEEFQHYDMANNGMVHPMESMGQMVINFPTESHFDTSLDYTDDFPSTSFDESIHYNTPFEFDMGNAAPGAMENADLPNEFSPEGNYVIERMHPEAIVVGLNENYHPEPMPGLVLQPGEVLENPEVNFPMYDEPIIPAAMMHIDSPAVQEPHFGDDYIDNPMPEMPPMLEFPRPVAEIPVEQDPMASMHPMINEDMSPNEISDFEKFIQFDMDNSLVDPSTESNMLDMPLNSDDSAFEVDSSIKPQNDILVIELDLRNQEALVNGKPFSVSRPTTLLGLISQIIKSATMSRRLPMQEDYTPSGFRPRPSYTYYFNDEMNPDMMMQNKPEPYGFQTPYMHSQYGQEHEYDPYYGSSDDYDYMPYNPFLNAMRRRLMSSRFNRMRSFDNRFDYDYMPHYNGRFDYDPYW